MPDNGILDRIGSPADLRALPAAELPELAARIRRVLVDRVHRTGGHLGSNLGVVELTIALHRVFDSPRDALVFDTGHQSYVHKMLTGRLAGFDTLRKAGGLAGYPARAESPHDLVENSHASTALSYADGLARAGRAGRVVAVVGDGALTGGMSWEALNNLGTAGRPVVVVLNDNGRSYAPTVGGVAAHLSALRGGDSADNVFRALGLDYLGPVDGHDLAATERALRVAGESDRPVVVHVVTAKGRGYPPAEAHDDDHFHAVGTFDPATGKAAAVGQTWTSVFADEITEIGARRPDVVCLTAAMLRPTGLHRFAERFPDRVFDVGIAEQHAVTCAAGLAMGGRHPVVAVYATFLNRAFDQLLMDVALHRLPVTFVLDRAGITGPDGPSHHGMWDASVLPVVPGLRLAAPRDPKRLRELLNEAISIDDGPTVVRYPKSATGPDIPAERRIGGADVLRDGADVLLVAVGPMALACLSAAVVLDRHGVSATVVDPRWTVPLSDDLVALAGGHQVVVVVEDTVATGSLGCRLAAALAGTDTRVATVALPSRFLPHAERGELLRAAGLTADGIAARVLDLCARYRRADLTEVTG
ncbi:1-deoxy-D-xylulose 5-phosphate synthase [Alloactinosynnema sp. L-07]|uniref:1-deoxy-D-xylulose-5-phosphate synthase n=1 Tax=Alloactinosynnema sp. L-07 TaxID=1653480 RepID=UPI00065EFB0F|nr:1-deoxy-D-xylulose-5-phosphate synthase [Alloactinosynnema sp. L-07]CRK61650.1 1-deoxy-D-xylulose 5-phosphate synthase [Alloactinosynnema sp. L-07]